MTDTVNVPREPTEAMLIAGANPKYPCDAKDVWAAMLAAAPKVEPVSDPYKLDSDVKILTGQHKGKFGTIEMEHPVQGSVRIFLVQIDGWPTANYRADEIELVTHPEAPKADGMDTYTRPDTMREILDRQLSDKSRRLNPEAPKVEQEPCGTVAIIPRKPTEKEISEIRYNINRKRSDGSDLTECDVREVIDNYFYNVGKPHPAPASGELLEAAIETVAKFDAASNTPVKDTPLGINRLRGAIAKRKGPQS